jgi:hypothetical protein
MNKGYIADPCWRSFDSVVAVHVEPWRHGALRLTFKALPSSTISSAPSPSLQPRWRSSRELLGFSSIATKSHVLWTPFEVVDSSRWIKSVMTRPCNKTPYSLSANRSNANVLIATVYPFRLSACIRNQKPQLRTRLTRQTGLRPVTEPGWVWGCAADVSGRRGRSTTTETYEQVRHPHCVWGHGSCACSVARCHPRDFAYTPQS